MVLSGVLENGVSILKMKKSVNPYFSNMQACAEGWGVGNLRIQTLNRAGENAGNGDQMSDRGQPNTSRIKFAWHSPTWRPDEQSHGILESTAAQVTAAECDESMEGNLYCPRCFTHVFRSPRTGPVFANGRRACFAHYPRNRDIPCELRSTKPEGKRYASEEEARKAIGADELVIISAFQDKPALAAELSTGTYDQSAVEDIDGPLVDLPISRYQGESFKLPSKLMTVSAICRNFPLNLHRYYVFPGSNVAMLLTDALRCITSVEAEDDVPRLYYGRIKTSMNAGRSRENIRMTWLEHAPSVKDFCIKDTDGVQRNKGIGGDSNGRIVLVWGRVTHNGIGLCIKGLRWGEYALLPPAHDHLLQF